jgi:hypothetical protein
MPTLSAEQLSILQYHANAGDRIAYYTALGAFGFAYGNLALGVVLNNTVSGAAANSFFGRLKDWRRVATRYDRCPKVFLSAIALAATAMFWL